METIKPTPQQEQITLSQIFNCTDSSFADFLKEKNRQLAEREQRILSNIAEALEQQRQLCYGA